MTDPSNELNDIKAILRTLAEQQLRTQNQLDDLRDTMAGQQANSQRQIDDLREILQTSIPDLTDMVGTVLHNMDEQMAEFRATIAADRADRTAERLAETRARSDFRAEMRGLQTESRNLLRELADLRRQDPGSR
jgi:hypothetical protein